jgi:hypothetical protein
VLHFNYIFVVNHRNGTCFDRTPIFVFRIFHLPIPISVILETIIALSGLDVSLDCWVTFLVIFFGAKSVLAQKELWRKKLLPKDLIKEEKLRILIYNFDQYNYDEFFNCINDLYDWAFS